MSKCKLHQITPRIYWLSPDETTDRPVLGAVVGSQGALIVDAGNSPAHANQFLQELAKVGVAGPDYLVLTHWHWDHVFGTDAFNVPTFASQETQRLVTEMAQQDWSDEALDRRVAEGKEIEFCSELIKVELPDRKNLKLVPPNIAFRKQVDIDLGDVTCQVIHVGGDDAHDHSIVFIPEEKVVFLGDCLNSDLYNGPRNYATAKLFPLIDTILGLAADYYLFGHDSEPMSRVELETYIDELSKIGRAVDEIGDNRARILQELLLLFGEALNEEHIEIADEFLAGLRRIEVDMPSLKTDNLTLRPFTLDDVEAMFQIMSGEDMLRYFPSSTPPTMAQVERLIRRMREHWQTYGYGLWAIESRADGTLLGRCGLQYIPETQEVEIDFILGRPYWGHGYATEAGQASLWFGFEKMNFTEVVGIVHLQNGASQRVLEKLGLQLTAETEYFGMECYRYALLQGEQ